jgi:hypothetical protein
LKAWLVGPARLHALIDGVFAIAVTLLVLNLPKPEGSTRLAHDLLGQWPTYVAGDSAQSGEGKTGRVCDARSGAESSMFRSAQSAAARSRREPIPP